jgi:hypothetical protein
MSGGLFLGAPHNKIALRRKKTNVANLDPVEPFWCVPHHDILKLYLMKAFGRKKQRII